MWKHFRHTISTIFHFIGLLTIEFSLFLLIPLLYSLFGKNTIVSYSFIYTLAISLSIGVLFFFFCKSYKVKNSTAFLICTFSWIIFSILGGLPFYFSLDISFINAFFEGTSGFTTTGTSILKDISNLPPSLLVWRSLMQWLGGLGIIAFFLSIHNSLPGTHRLYEAESAKIDSTRPVPGLVNTLRILFFIYVAGTVIVILLLWFQGISFFHSLTHGLTCVSTGGFSSFTNNIQGFQELYPAKYSIVRTILVFGMLFGAINFLLHYRFFLGQWKAIFDTKETKTWLSLLVFSTLVLFIFSKQTNTQTIHDIIFNVVSFSSTAGYTFQSFTSLTSSSVSFFILLLLMTIGSCHGSTTGGIKVQRIVIASKALGREVAKLWAPEEVVLPIIIDKKKVPENAIQQALLIIFVWFLTLSIGTILLLFDKSLSLSSAFTAQLSALSNFGPSALSIEQLISSSVYVKTILIISMIAGRIEILPIILLFQKKVWF